MRVSENVEDFCILRLVISCVMDVVRRAVLLASPETFGVKVGLVVISCYVLVSQEM